MIIYALKFAEPQQPVWYQDKYSALVKKLEDER